MSFVKKFITATIHGSVYSSLVGCSYKAFADNNWDMNNLPKIVLFWVLVAVPGGIAWNKVNQVVFNLIGTKREILWNLATFNKKALACDFLLNNVIYQSLFVTAFFEYCKRVLPKEENKEGKEGGILNPESAKENLTHQTINYQDQIIDDPLYSTNNILYLVKLRLKVALASYFLDMWGPWVLDNYLKNNKIKFAKDMFLGLIWNTGVLKKYYYPEPLETEEERGSNETKNTN